MAETATDGIDVRVERLPTGPVAIPAADRAAHRIVGLWTPRCYVDIKGIIRRALQMMPLEKFSLRDQLARGDQLLAALFGDNLEPIVEEDLSTPIWSWRDSLAELELQNASAHSLRSFSQKRWPVVTSIRLGGGVPLDAPSIQSALNQACIPSLTSLDVVGVLTDPAFEALQDAVLHHLPCLVECGAALRGERSAGRLALPPTITSLERRPVRSLSLAGLPSLRALKFSSKAPSGVALHDVFQELAELPSLAVLHTTRFNDRFWKEVAAGLLELHELALDLSSVGRVRFGASSVHFLTGLGRAPISKLRTLVMRSPVPDIQLLEWTQSGGLPSLTPLYLIHWDAMTIVACAHCSRCRRCTR